MLDSKLATMEHIAVTLMEQFVFQVLLTSWWPYTYPFMTIQSAYYRGALHTNHMHKQGKPSSHESAVSHLFVTNTTKVKLTQSIATRSLEATHTEHVCLKLHHSA